MASVCTIIGVKNSKTKDGNPAATYFYTEEYNDYDLKNGKCEGVKTGSQYTSNIFLQDVKVGDKVKFYHEVINSRSGSFTILSDMVKVENNNKK